MEIQATKEGNAVVISLTGSLNAVTSPEFATGLSVWIAKGENNFLLNFAHLDYISSAGLGTILNLYKKLNATQGKVYLVGLHGSAEQVFKISGVLSFFKVFASTEEALREF